MEQLYGFGYTHKWPKVEHFSPGCACGVNSIGEVFVDPCCHVNEKSVRMVLNCFKCNKELESSTPLDNNQPYAGTTFISHGQYGSTVWDPPNPMSRYWLEINICDDCLVENRIQVLRGIFIPTGHNEYQPWDPEEEN